MRTLSDLADIDGFISINSIDTAMDIERADNAMVRMND